MRFHMPHITPPHVSIPAPHIKLSNISIPHIPALSLPAINHIIRTATTTTTHTISHGVHEVANAEHKAAEAAGHVVIELDDSEQHVVTEVHRVASGPLAHKIVTVVNTAKDAACTVTTLTLLTGEVITTVETGDPATAAQAIGTAVDFVHEAKQTVDDVKQTH